MPFFQLEDSSLVPFRRQAIASGVYEDEIEGLLWDNLEELTGENLFRVARQPVLPLGRPDVIALDLLGRIVVIEVKRDVDRNQLAQALEYAGWALGAGLDELARKYHGGEASFWDDWKEFTGTDTPTLVHRKPQLVLVARSFEPKTAKALEFLVENGLPVKLLQVAFYADDDGNRFLNVEWENEPETSVGGPAAASASQSPTAATTTLVDFREVTLAEVAELVGTPADLVWVRPKKNERFEAILLAKGVIRLDDGREFRSPSGAAMAAAEVVSYDGWYAWRLGEGGPALNDFRHQIAAASAAPNPSMDQAVSGVAPEEAGANGMLHEPESPLDESFPRPALLDTWVDQLVDVDHLGPIGWEGHSTPQEHALEPCLDWTEEHKALVEKAYLAKWAKHYGPEATCVASWPPTASLWTEGSFFERDADECSEHGLEVTPGCEECDLAEPAFTSVEPAEWHWYVTVEISDLVEGEAEEVESDQFHFMSTKLDPRQVEYSLAPLR